MNLVGRSRVQDFFRIPLGLIYSIDVRTYAVTDNRIKHSCIELLTKDQRKLSFIMRDYDEALRVRDIIKSTSFLDNIESLEKRQQNFFAVSMYEYITNEHCHVNPLSRSQMGLFQNDVLTSILKLVELNKEAWNVYTEPYKEFVRQGCKFEQKSNFQEVRQIER